MPKKEWEYYSLHWIECSQQWQITQDQTNNNGNACHWDYLDDACEDLGRMGWKPILLNDSIVLFKRKKQDA